MLCLNKVSSSFVFPPVTGIAFFYNENETLSNLQTFISIKYKKKNICSVNMMSALEQCCYCNRKYNVIKVLDIRRNNFDQGVYDVSFNTMQTCAH